MRRFLRMLRAVKTAVPAFVETFNTVMTAVEHVALRLALLALMAYGLYHALAR